MSTKYVVNAIIQSLKLLYSQSNSVHRVCMWWCC